MRICFVTGNTLKEFRERFQESPCLVSADGDEKKIDLFLFGFGGMGEVSYEKELKGETSNFEDAALFSKESKALVVCGCITDTRGHKRKSACLPPTEPVFTAAPIGKLR